VDKPYTCGALAFASNIVTFNREVAAFNAAVKANHGAFPPAATAVGSHAAEDGRQDLELAQGEQEEAEVVRPGRLGVLGWPVAHSRSPAMHEAAFAALGLEGFSYQLLPVPPELFEETVRALPQAGFIGANVTVPHKSAALASPTARAHPRARSAPRTRSASLATDRSVLRTPTPRGCSQRSHSIRGTARPLC